MPTGIYKRKPNKKKIRRECEVCFMRFGIYDYRQETARFCSKRCHSISKKSKKGENGANWRGGGWIFVRNQILIEQDYTCQNCGHREPEIMEVNHKLEKSQYPELARDINNLEVLCPNCHRRKTNSFLKTKGLREK